VDPDAGAPREYEHILVKNQQGDVEKVIRTVDQAIVASYTYDAWGRQLTCTGSKASTVGTYQPFRYRGYIYDFESGLYYVSSRYYDPEICRWINADDAECLGVEGELLSYNLFAYCLNDPVNRTDVNGNWSLPNWAKKTIAAVAVVAVVAAVAAVTVATAGTGTAAAVIAIGAAKGAAVGMVSGAAIGAGTSAIKHRVQTGSWNGAGEAALNGIGDI
jgi:RHS repeat-associated protein